MVIQPKHKVDGAEIRKRRQAMGLTAAELGQKIGVSEKHILGIENEYETQRNPSYFVLMDLAELFGCTMDDLTTRRTGEHDGKGKGKKTGRSQNRGSS